MAFLLMLGLLDLFFAAMMLLTHLGVLDSWRIAIAGMMFWAGKGILYRGSFLSVVDFLAGVYFILVMIGAHTPIVYLFLGVMMYKFTVSVVMRG